MSKAFTREDEDDADNRVLLEAYLRQRAAELGGGGAAAPGGAPQVRAPRPMPTEVLPPQFIERVLPSALKEDAVTLSRLSKVAQRSSAVAAARSLAASRRKRLAARLTSLEPSTQETLAAGAKAYGEYRAAIEGVKHALAQLAQRARAGGLGA